MLRILNNCMKKNITLRILFCVGFYFSFTLLFAQKNSKFEIYGRVVDFVTNQAIDSVIVDLLTTDSVPINRGFSYCDEYDYKKKSYFIFEFEKQGDYLMRFSHPDYETYYQPIKVKFYKRMHSNNIGIIPMKRIRNIQLDGVVINKTKIKFYFKKDTLVYNADAFLTQDGFVLNEILKKMPGIVIKNGSEIEANGRKVQALLLNGKDFFNNDRKTLLENMPAFMVKDIKLYDKRNDSLSLIKRERDFSGYVMDVKLKKGYQSFVLGNSDMAYGTSNRYYSKLFGLKYNSLSKIYAYAIANNTNKDETITDNGITSNKSNGDGDNKFSKIGFSYDFDHAKGLYALKGDATINYSDMSSETQTLGRTFFSDGDIYYRQLNKTNTYQLTVKSDHSFYFFGNTPWDFAFIPSFEYEKNVGNSINIQGSFNKDITSLWGTDWIDSLISRNLTQAMEMYGINKQSLRNKNDTYAMKLNLAFDKTIMIPHTNDLFSLYANYKSHKMASEKYEKNDMMFKTDEINLSKYNDYNSHNHELYVKGIYDFKISEYNSLTLLYDYTHTSLYNKNPFYSLHELTGWDYKSLSNFGQLPSQNELLKVLDSNNSYSFSQYEKTHKIEFGYLYSKFLEQKRTDFSIKIPFIIENKTLNFHQESNDTIIRRKKHSPQITICYSNQITTHNHNIFLYSIQYDYKNTMPSLYNLLNIRNDVNPLYVTSGNAKLKDMQHHEFFGQLFLQTTRFYIHRMNFTYYLTYNQFANSLLYDRINGITYITPCNVDGNRYLSVNLSNSLYVKHNRMISFNNDLNLTWQHCADYVSTTGNVNSEKRIVKNFSLSDRLFFTFASNNTKHRLNGHVYLTYSCANSKDKNFTRKDLLNYGLQCTASTELPYNILIQTNILSVCRRGYNFTDMNDEEYIWGANINKKFGEKYSINLELYDILGQRKNIYHYLDAQGCRDIFYNNMKRYMMLHFIYRFNISKQLK